MSQVFISYSRKDKAFVQKLAEALTGQKKDIWVDWEDIPPTAKWLREICDGIETADNFIKAAAAPGAPSGVHPGQCLGGKWHSQEPISIGNLGPQEDYLEVIQFPCCGTKVLADRAPSRFRSDGCQESPIVGE